MILRQVLSSMDSNSHNHKGLAQENKKGESNIEFFVPQYSPLMMHGDEGENYH